MRLAAGTRLGAYEVGVLLGAGGMGEVYLAVDTRLDRQVAIKVLPEAVRTDPERAARFEREAKLLATLNHPNIATIHGLEQADGEQFIVMELVEGETLADRTARGPIPISEALQIANQIAQALEAAHEKGIIHRDLKPANVKLTPDEKVKVLDFGLAKAFAGDGSGPSSVALNNSPTLTSPVAVTGVGILLGTAAYMSPEQARGKPTDKRADIWAFGCVLFEMLAGAPLFHGEDLAETVGAVIHTRPSLERLPPNTPRSVRLVLQRCLDKDPRTRLRDIGEARIAIENVSVAEDAAEEPVILARWRWLPWTVAGVTTVMALSTVLWSRVSAPSTVQPNTVVKFHLTAPNATTFPIPAAMMALSPNGRTLAFVAIDSRGRRTLWYRDLDVPHAVPLPGTDGASDPFWSFDSRSVAYFTDTTLSAVDVQSGRLQTIWEGVGTGGTWGRGDLIVFGTATGLYRVPASGGDATAIVDSSRAPGQSNWHSPKSLPDGQHLLYVARTADSPNYHAFITTLEQPAPRRLMPVQSKVEYVEPGWIFFVASGRLLAQRFDAEAVEAIGEPIALASDLLGNAANGRKAFTVSPAGVLAFRERPDDTALEVRDRSGKRLAQVGQMRDLFPVALSSDDKRLLFRRNEDVWTADLSTGRETRITFDAPGNVSPVWSPDSKWIAFRLGGRLYRVPSDGSGPSEDIGPASGALTQWVSDGSSLLSDSTGGIRQIRLLDPTQPEELPRLPSGAREGQISSDGKWIAYAYPERGDYQIYVQPLSVGGGRWQVSQNGGRQPRWRRDGRELFYVSADGNITAAEIRSANGFEIITTRPLFDIGAATGLPNNVGFYYDASSDGQRFVFSTDFFQQIRTPISVVLNWPEELRRLVPTD